MPTVNINLTPEQARLVNKTAKERGFANRSEFFRALLRFVFFNKPRVIKNLETAEFEQPAASPLTLEEIKKRVAPILKKNDVEFAGIFGSYARGDARPDSDLDLLIRYKPDTSKSLFDLVGLQRILAEALGVKVDLGVEGSIDELVKPNVEKDIQVLYGQRRDI